MWWRDALIYQVYVRSFADANGDGHGDLPGLRSRLDYLEWLGVDAVWLTPINPSPNEDWGYDVADFRGVHPDYGTLDDLDALVADARARGIRVLLDLVPNHTSDQHPWFRDPAKRDWYVWADRPEQLALHVRRPGLDVRPRRRPVLPAQLPPGAARPELVERRRPRRVRRDPPLLVRPRRRRLPDRRRARDRQGRAVARQPAPQRDGRPAGAHVQHEPPRGPRGLQALAQARGHVRRAARARRRDVGERPRRARALLRRGRPAPPGDELPVRDGAVPRAGAPPRRRVGGARLPGRRLAGLVRVEPRHRPLPHALVRRRRVEDPLRARAPAHAARDADPLLRRRARDGAGRDPEGRAARPGAQPRRRAHADALGPASPTETGGCATATSPATSRRCATTRARRCRSPGV